MRTKNHRQTPDIEGFTLLELIVVICLMGIVAAFAFPRFSSTFFRDKKEITINQLHLNVVKLKKEAPIQGQTLMMCFAEGSGTVSIKAAARSPVSGETTAIAEFLLPDGMTVDTIEFSPGTAPHGPCIRFHKKGYSDPAIIHLSDSDGRRFSLVIPKFLHRVDYHEGDIRFDDA